MHEKKTPMLLIKFMDEEYVDKFINEGLLYMNTADYFKKYESKDPALRGDIHEGLTESLLPEEIIMTVNGRVITQATQKIDMCPLDLDQVNIYCMAIINHEEIVAAGENGLTLSKDFEKFGNKAVVIFNRDIIRFINLIKNAIEANSSLCATDEENILANTVSYVSRQEHHSKLNIFNKFKEYEWQREWRVAVKNVHKSGVLELKIGNLSGMAQVLDTKDFTQASIKVSPYKNNDGERP